MLNVPIVLLRPGTENTEGVEHTIGNINACSAIADYLRTTLGPHGMDKLMYNDRNFIVTNDGATIMEWLQISHPVAQLLQNVSKNQDHEIGDGTTSIVLVSAALLEEVKSFIQDGVSISVIVNGFKLAEKLALEYLSKISSNIKTDSYKRNLLLIAKTALQSKLLCANISLFSNLAVDAVQMSMDHGECSLYIKSIVGGVSQDSQLIKGVAMKKSFSYAGFEQQPKYFENPKILLLNLELEISAEKDNAEIKLQDPNDYLAVVDAEWKILYDKLDDIRQTGANVVLSRLPIGDVATQYFADENIFCAGRVTEEDMKQCAEATGASIVVNTKVIKSSMLGSCKKFSEIEVASQRWNFFYDCNNPVVTLILKGGSKIFTDEANRSMNDAITVVKRAIKYDQMVPGAGAVEAKLGLHLQKASLNYADKRQAIVNAVGNAFMHIPETIASNCGLPVGDIMAALLKRNTINDAEFYGIDYSNKCISPSVELGVMEPLTIKQSIVKLALGFASCVVMINETFVTPPSTQVKSAAEQAINDD